jgi:Domain of unknown function (DUF4389)
MDDTSAMPLAATASASASYPLRLGIDPAKQTMNRLWGIPYLGALVRAILLIPMYIGLGLLGIAVYVVVLLNWIPVLFTGRQAGWVYSVTGTYFDWSWRSTAYVSLLVGGYPLASGYGAWFQLDRDQHFNQLWGIPFVGIGIRSLLLIPHYVVLFFLAILVGVLVLFSWVPVLINGRQADGFVTWISGFIRWYTRVLAYGLLVTNRYPPFSLD